MHWKAYSFLGASAARQRRGRLLPGSTELIGNAEVPGASQSPSLGLPVNVQFTVNSVHLPFWATCLWPSQGHTIPGHMGSLSPWQSGHLRGTQSPAIGHLRGTQSPPIGHLRGTQSPPIARQFWPSQGSHSPRPLGISGVTQTPPVGHLRGHTVAAHSLSHWGHTVPATTEVFLTLDADDATATSPPHRRPTNAPHARRGLAAGGIRRAIISIRIKHNVGIQGPLWRWRSPPLPLREAQRQTNLGLIKDHISLGLHSPVARATLKQNAVIFGLSGIPNHHANLAHGVLAGPFILRHQYIGLAAKHPQCGVAGLPAPESSVRHSTFARSQRNVPDMIGSHNGQIVAWYLSFIATTWCRSHAEVVFTNLDCSLFIAAFALSNV